MTETWPLWLGAGTVGGLLLLGTERASARTMRDRDPSAPASGQGPTAARAGAPATSTAGAASSPPTRPAASSPSRGLPGRWVWPVETFQGRRSVITSGFGPRGNAMHRGVDILFRREPGDTAGGRVLPYPPQVERWRAPVQEHAPDLAIDFLLTWIERESGGNPCALGIPDKEAGLFQSYHPDNDRHGATFAELRAACEPGSQRAARPLTAAEQRLHITSGIALVRECLAIATRTLRDVGAEWTPADRYCLAKLVHALPAFALRFPRGFARAQGRPPKSWAELRAWVRSLGEAEVIAIDRGAAPWASVAQRDRLWGNAERVGAAVTRIGGPWVVPPGVRALAASDGAVWSAERTARGFAVVIDHGRVGYATFYTHLSRLFVQPTQRSRSGERVYAGQPLGEVGADPLDPQRLPHLHFELWKGGPRDAIDPEPLMRSWERISVPDSLGPPQRPLRPPPLVASREPTASDPSDGSAHRNASLTYRSVGARGEPYPDWVRALDGSSGVYVIREIRDDGTREVVYVGQSSRDRLYDTLTRHFQTWRRWKGFWRGRYGQGHDPGLTYDRNRVEVAVRVTSADAAFDEEARLIRRLRPRDNVIGQADDETVPF